MHYPPRTQVPGHRLARTEQYTIVFVNPVPLSRVEVIFIEMECSAIFGATSAGTTTICLEIGPYLGKEGAIEVGVCLEVTFFRTPRNFIRVIERQTKVLGAAKIIERRASTQNGAVPIANEMLQDRDQAEQYKFRVRKK